MPFTSFRRATPSAYKVSISRTRASRRRWLGVLLLALVVAVGVSACGGTGGTGTTSTAGEATATPSAAGSPTATQTSATTTTPTVPTWDVSPYTASPAPGPCDKGGGQWVYFNNGTQGTYFCRGPYLQMTALSTTNFSGVSGKLAPDLEIDVTASSMTGNAQASVILVLHATPAANPSGTRTYYFDCDLQGNWTVRRYNPQVILVQGTTTAATMYALRVTSKGHTRAFSINGTTVTTQNDGLTFTGPSIAGISAGGSATNSILFSSFTYKPL